MDEDTSGHTAIPLDNSGCGPLQVPGFNDIPLYYELKSEDRFAHGEREWRQTPGVTAREQAMVDLMNKVTDKPGWNVDVFNDEIVDNWRKWAFETYHLMSEKAWSWCLEELRDKAAYFKETKHVRVLDTGTCVCKSDTPDLQALATLFKSAATPLLDQHRSGEGWQPTSEDPILNLVDPSTFPLVYGRSLVLENGGHVDIRDIFGSYKDATVAPKHFDRRADRDDVQEETARELAARIGVYIDFRRSEHNFYYWSSNYQWLPCDVKFTKSNSTKVRLTSYINNLHPTHESLYHDIEKLISLSIPLWNDCLVRGHSGFGDNWNQGQLGPVSLRILTLGIEWENELPEWAPAFKVPSNFRKKWYREVLEEYQRINSMTEKTDEDGKRLRAVQARLEGLFEVVGREDMELPPLDSDLWRKAREYLELPEGNSESSLSVALPEDWTRNPWSHIRCKLDRLICWKHPEPGTTFSYKDWKTGSNNNEAIIDIVRERPEWNKDSQDRKPVVPDFKPYNIRLQETFSERGVQVIVHMDSIELSPENPVYYGSAWQLPGQLNEHIVAVTVFPYDVLNVTGAKISFRQETPIPEEFYRYAEERFTPGCRRYPDERDYRPLHRYGKSAGMEIQAISEILGIKCRNLLYDWHWDRTWQKKGSVATPQGRLVTFPNVLEHRINRFKLVNPLVPGHYRAVKLYLVDPHYRICSTRNVPPQQHHWWAQEVTTKVFYKNTALPQELIDEVIKGTEDWPMGLQEATQHRFEMIKEHRWNDYVRLGSMPRFNFD